jgi:hypothetical protein
MALSRHEVRDSDVRFRGYGGHPLGLAECLLVTQRGLPQLTRTCRGLARTGKQERTLIASP